MAHVDESTKTATTRRVGRAPTVASPPTSQRPLPNIPELPVVDPVKPPITATQEFFGVYMAALSGVPGAVETTIQLIADQTKRFQDRRERADFQRTNIQLDRRQQAIDERKDIFATRSREELSALDRKSREDIAAGDLAARGLVAGQKAREDSIAVEQKDLEIQGKAQRNLDLALQSLQSRFKDIPVGLDMPKEAGLELMKILNQEGVSEHERISQYTTLLHRVLTSRVAAVAGVNAQRKAQYVREAVGIIRTWTEASGRTKERQVNFLRLNLRSVTDPVSKVDNYLQLTPDEAIKFTAELTDKLLVAWQDDKILDFKDAESLSKFFSTYNADPNFLAYMDQAFTKVADHIASQMNRNTEEVRQQMTQFMQDAIETGEGRIGMADLLLDRQATPLEQAFAIALKPLIPEKAFIGGEGAVLFRDAVAAIGKSVLKSAFITGRKSLTALRDPDETNEAFNRFFSASLAQSEQQERQIVQLEVKLEAQLGAGKMPTRSLIRRMMNIRAKQAGKKKPTTAQIDATLKVIREQLAQKGAK